MAKIKEVEKVVRHILEDNLEARKDDYILIVEVFKHYNVEVLSVDYVLRHHTSLGLPSIATITRCRRKLQADNPILRLERVRNKRLCRTADYIRYAIGEDYEIL